MKDIKKIEDEIAYLKSAILKAQKAYYVDSNVIMSDKEYDKLFDRLLYLEEKYPQFKDLNSPTQRIGSDLDNKLPEIAHSTPILSLEKCYSALELSDWIIKNKEKLKNEMSVIIEPKIDGAGVVLYYENGRLAYALTRGNGLFGNEITNNIKTIKSIPLTVEYNKKFAVRGEVFINKNDFADFNEKYAEGKYSNPRNLASGAIRRIKSKETALFPLNIFIYEGYFDEDKKGNHLDILILLKNLGFPLNKYIGYFGDSINKNISLPFKEYKTGDFTQINNYLNNLKSIRKNLQLEIDGLVIKINDIKSREILGFTSHHPRWAIAYKFDPPLVQTKVNSIVVQIGRGGRATPVANLEPVELSGSIISRATLHNQDYINSIDVNINDIVTISKRGDVIPAVEEVVEKGENVNPFKLPDLCPSCKTGLIEDGAHLFCPNDQCPAQLLGTLQFFVSRGQMDIETLGDKTIEFLFNQGFIKFIPDIYEFNYDKLLDFEGFKEKKIENIKNSILKSKEKDFKTVLSSLGLKDIGNKVSELLAKNYKTIDEVIKIADENNIEELTHIDGIGGNLALSIIKHFNNTKVKTMIDKLKKAGLNFKTIEKTDFGQNLYLSGTKWVITGSFKNFQPREKAADLIKKHGGEITDVVSGKTTHLLCGESPGSKLEKAGSFGTKIVYEDDFLKMIKEEKI